MLRFTSNHYGPINPILKIVSAGLKINSVFFPAVWPPVDKLNLFLRSKHPLFYFFILFLASHTMYTHAKLRINVAFICNSILFCEIAGETIGKCNKSNYV